MHILESNKTVKGIFFKKYDKILSLAIIHPALEYLISSQREQLFWSDSNTHVQRLYPNYPIPVVLQLHYQ